MIRIEELPAMVATVNWDAFKAQLVSAVDVHIGETADDLEDMRANVRNGQAMIIQIYDEMVVKATGLIQIVIASNGERSLHIRYLGGADMADWLDELQVRMREIARQYDCQWITINGRPGWVKMLDGFKVESQLIRSKT